MLPLATDENFNNKIVRALLRRKPDLAVSLGRAIDDILLLVECSLENEWEGQIRYVPF